MLEDAAITLTIASVAGRSPDGPDDANVDVGGTEVTFSTKIQNVNKKYHRVDKYKAGAERSPTKTI